MKTSRTKSAILNVFFNLCYQIVNTVVNMIIPPLIMTKFGSVINGLVSTVKQILSYVQLLGAGISESTVVSLYKPLAEKDNNKISAIFNACSVTFFRMGMLFNAGAVAIAFLYPLFISEKIDYVFGTLLILVLSIAGASEFFVIGKCRSLLIADQKMYIVNIAQIIGAVSNLIVTIVLINIDANIILVQAGSSIIYAMRIMVVYTYVKRNYSFLDKVIEPDYSAISKRKAATIHQLSGLISFGSQTVIVSLFCGLAEASVYSVYNLVFVGINTILSTVSSALLAIFGDIIANDSREKLTKLYRYYESVYYALVFIMYTITYIMFLSFIELYTSGTTDAVYVRGEFAILFCIMGMVNCLRTPGATLINAIGHYKETQSRALIEMTICFVLELILINFMGASGVIVATIVAYGYRTVDVIIYSNHKILGESVKKSAVKILTNILMFVGIWGLMTIVQLPKIASYIQWIVVAAIVAMIVAVLYLILNCIAFKNDFTAVLSYVRRRKE